MIFKTDDLYIATINNEITIILDSEDYDLLNNKFLDESDTCENPVNLFVFIGDPEISLTTLKNLFSVLKRYYFFYITKGTYKKTHFKI